MSGWCQLWNHFSFDWAILSSEPLCSVQLDFLQPLIVSDTPSASQGFSCQKVEPLCNRHVTSYPNSHSPGIAKDSPPVELQAHSPSWPSGTDMSQPKVGSMSTPTKQSPQHARLGCLPGRTSKMQGFNFFLNSVVPCEEPPCKESPTKKRAVRLPVRWWVSTCATQTLPQPH